MFKVNNKNTRKRCEICSKLAVRSTSLTSISNLFSSVSIVNFEEVIADWISLVSNAPWGNKGEEINYIKLYYTCQPINLFSFLLHDTIARHLQPDQVYTTRSCIILSGWPINCC